MVKHIVLFAFRRKATNEQIESALKALGEICAYESATSFSFGKNNSPEGLDHGYQYGVVMEFNSAEDRDSYVQCQSHDKWVKEHLMPIISRQLDPMVLDFEAY